MRIITPVSRIILSFQALVPAVLQLAAMVFRMLSLSPLLTFSTLCVSLRPCLPACLPACLPLACSSPSSPSASR